MLAYFSDCVKASVDQEAVLTVCGETPGLWYLCPLLL